MSCVGKLSYESLMRDVDVQKGPGIYCMQKQKTSACAYAYAPPFSHKTRCELYSNKLMCFGDSQGP